MSTRPGLVVRVTAMIRLSPNGRAGNRGYRLPLKHSRSGTMSEHGHNRFEIPKEMRSMAEASVDQARGAFEKFLSGAQATAGRLEQRGATVRAGARDIGAKAISNAEKNMQASLDYAESLLHAKDPTEVMRLHGEYVQ